MGRATNKLSVKFTEKPDMKPGLYGDGNGLYLQVSNRGTKALGLQIYDGSPRPENGARRLRACQP